VALRHCYPDGLTREAMQEFTCEAESNDGTEQVLDWITSDAAH
jgi:hypothetical protein